MHKGKLFALFVCVWFWNELIYSRMAFVLDELKEKALFVQGLTSVEPHDAEVSLIENSYLFPNFLCTTRGFWVL